MRLGTSELVAATSSALTRKADEVREAMPRQEDGDCDPRETLLICIRNRTRR
jgi:hypothetical protein